MTLKLKIRLTYYLQLQDRVEEALSVFNTLDLTDENLYSLATDYMFAYFQFCKTEDLSNTESFEKLKDIVKKHEDCPLQAFKSMFN